MPNFHMIKTPKINKFPNVTWYLPFIFPDFFFGGEGGEVPPVPISVFYAYAVYLIFLHATNICQNTMTDHNSLFTLNMSSR